MLFKIITLYAVSTTTTSPGAQCPICYNGGYCVYVNGFPTCQCPCLYSGTNCQTCTCLNYEYFT